MIKYGSLIVFLLVAQVESFACEFCKKQQPKITQGLTHGGGPQSNWDWVIISFVAAIAVVTLVYSIKYLVKPHEGNADHIKQSILIH
jgi:hypothetical protein